MSRYIDRYKTIDALQRSDKDPIDVLFEQPDADIRENVRGEWINMERIEDDKAEYITEWQQAQCSVCHKWHTTPYMYFFTHDNFCPNCGADMRPISALSENAEIVSKAKGAQDD